jgi:hypothetical protein
MGLASHSYHDVNQFIPPYYRFEVARLTSPFGNIIGNTYEGVTFSYFCSILPYIEQANLDALTVSTGTNSDGSTFTMFDGQRGGALWTPVKLYINPSDPAGNGTGLSYRGVMATAIPAGAPAPPTSPPLFGTVGYAANANATSYISVQTFRDGTPSQTTATTIRMNLGIHYPDGTSNTVLLAEKYSVTIKTGTTNYLQPTMWYYSSGTTSHGGGFFSLTFFYPWSTVESYPTVSDADPTHLHAPRSEGILVCMADASVRLVATAVFNTDTWQNACYPNDGNVLGPDW